MTCSVILPIKLFTCQPIIVIITIIVLSIVKESPVDTRLVLEQYRYVMTTPVTFLPQVWAELKKVTWPTRQEVIRLTATVILVSLIVGVFIGGLDFVFTSLLQVVVK